MNDDISTTSTGTLFLTFAGGALLGAGLALLFAPQSGSKTRRQIKGLAGDAEDYAQELAHEAAEGLKKAQQKAGHWVGQAKDHVEELKNAVASAVDGARG